MKRLLPSLFCLSLLLSSCSTGDTSNTWIDNLTGLESSPTPTATATPQPKARISLGEDDILEGDYEAALNQFWTAREQSTDPEIIAAAQLGVGRVLFLQTNYDGAIEQLNWLLSNISEGETRNTAFFYLAQAHLKLEQYSQAAAAFGEYLRTEPGPLDSEISEMQGDAYFNAEDYANALTAYQLARQIKTFGNSDSLDVKIARTLSASGDDGSAINALITLYESTSDDAIKAQINLLLGQIYLRLNEPEQAYARFQDSVINFPVYYDSYSGLVALVETGQPVNELMRGIVDYYAGKYGVAIEAFDRYLYDTPAHDATIHYYKALSLYKIGDYEGEIAEWDVLIRDHAIDDKYTTAFLEKATTLYDRLQRYEDAALTLLSFVALVPESSNAPDYLYRAARIYELGGYLSKAAATWERIINEYPGSEQAYSGLFQAGIIYYRLAAYEQAQVTFQRLLILALSPEEKSASALWIGKCLEKLGQAKEAQNYYLQAVDADPTGYYGIRGSQLAKGQTPFPTSANIDLSVDLALDKQVADQWMITNFNVDQTTDFSSIETLQTFPKFLRGQEYTKLGLRDAARNEFDTLREELIQDPLNTYRLLYYLIDHKYYQTAVFTSRQVLDQAGLSQEQTLTDAPKYFNHIRFGVFFREIVVSAANENDIDPLLIFSVIRLESMFEPSIASYKDARGLMQILPETGQEIVANFGWPTDFKISDLDRPMVNVRLGSKYLKKQITDFDGEISIALSAYNAGPGYTYPWQELSQDDVDLFVEMIRFEDTRIYIRTITEFYEIYKSIYTHP